MKVSMYFGNLWLRINIPNRNKMAFGRTSLATDPEDSRTKRLRENQPSALPPPRGTWAGEVRGRPSECNVLLAMIQSLASFRSIKWQSQQGNEEGVAWVSSRVDRGR